MALLVDVELLRLIDLQRGAPIVAAGSGGRSGRCAATKGGSLRRRVRGLGAARRQVPRTAVAAGARTAVRRVRLLVHAGALALHLELVALEDHFLLDHVRIREVRAVLVEAGIRVGAAVVTLELEVGVGRPWIRRPRIRIEGQAHLVLVLVLFGHLFERLRGRTQFSLGEVHVRVRRYDVLLHVLAVEHGRRIVVLVRDYRTVRVLHVVRRYGREILDVLRF